MSRSGRNISRKDVVPRQVDEIRGNGQRATIDHGVARVHCEIHNHLLELYFVRPDLRKGMCELNRDHDVSANETSYQLLTLVDHAIHVDRARLQWLSPSKRQQLLRECSRILGGAF